MTEPRRYSDSFSYKAKLTLIGVLVPIIANVGMVIYVGGRMTQRVDDLDRQVQALQAMVIAHIAAVGAMAHTIPQADKSTVPQVPAPKVQPQSSRSDARECHVPAITKGKQQQVNKWRESPPRS